VDHYLAEKFYILIGGGTNLNNYPGKMAYVSFALGPSASQKVLDLQNSREEIFKL
jgi:hypothetical protein